MSEIANYTLNDIVEGKTASFEASVTEAMVLAFAGLSGDNSPLHMQDDFAVSRGFKARVAHGGVLMGLLSRLVGVHLPGENAIWQSSNIQFVSPAYIGDRVWVKGQVDQLSPSTQTMIVKVLIERVGTQQVLLRGKVQVGFTKPGTRV